MNHVTCGIGTEGIPVYHERFPNQLAIIYGGQSGMVRIVRYEEQPEDIKSEILERKKQHILNKGLLYLKMAKNLFF